MYSQDYNYYQTDDLDYSSDDEIAEFKRRNEANRRAREKAKKEFDSTLEDDQIVNGIRRKALNVSNNFRTEYDEVRNRSWEKDQQTLQHIDEILKNVEKPTFHFHNRRRASYGSPRDVNIHEKKNMNLLTNKTEPLPLVDGRLRELNSSETARQKMKRVEEHLEGILDYELPSAENFKLMRHSLREINDKMSTHRLLMDRGNKSDMIHDDHHVADRIDEKYRELEQRMPCLSMSKRAYDEQNRINRFDPNLIAGYSTGLSITNSEQNAELRGRIRSLLCRTKRADSSEHYCKSGKIKT